MQINDLNQAASLSAGDLLALFSTDNSDTQSCSLTQLLDFINTQNGAGANGLVTQYASPSSTGFIVQAGSVALTWLNLTPNAAYATGTIVLPASPINQAEVNVSTTQDITVLTVSGNGKTVNGAPITLLANGFFTLRYDQVSLSWYRVA